MPLKVIIVGAGIGGLAAAIAFTKAGHDVEVFERSSFLNEVGAAIHLAPNATRILKAWNLDLESMEPSACDHLNIWKPNGEFVSTPVVTKDLQSKLHMEDEWLLVHRVDLHNGLRDLAQKGFAGRKPIIHLASPVKDADASTGKIVLEDGREFQADVVIGADGVHSRTVLQVEAKSQKKISTGQSCYRFLVSTDEVERSLPAKTLIEKVGLKSFQAWYNDSHRLVMYPCRAGKLLNFAAYVPDEPNSTVGESSWLNSGSKEDLINEFRDFAPELRELISLAQDVRLWSLASRDPPSVFYRGKLGLIGDAAHPTLPHQGQGGAQAFEDAAALGALFTADTRPEEVEQRLRLYNDVRYAHAVTILFMSRVGDNKREEVMDQLHRFVPDAELPENMFVFAWNSYPAKKAEQVLSAASP